MPSVNVQVNITAREAASAALKKLGAVSQKTGQKIKSQMGPALATVRKMAFAAAAAFGALVATGWGMVKQAGKYASIRDAFGGMAKGMGISADELEAKVKKASGGTLSRLQVLQGATKTLSLMGKEAFKDFGSEFSKMAELSKKAARATGADVSYMFESLITGMARESKMLLDNLGITVDLTQAKKDYAEVLKIEADELTIAESKTAVLRHTLEKLEETYGDVAVSAGGVSGKHQQLKTDVADLKLAIGEKLEPIFINLIENVLKPLVKEHIPNMLANLRTLFDYLGEQKENLIPVITVIGTLLVGAFLAWAKAAALAAFNTLLALSPLIAIGAAIGIVILAFKKISKNEKFIAFLENVRDLFKKIGEFLLGVQTTLKEFDTTIRKSFNVGDIFKGIGATIRGYQKGGIAWRPQLATVAEGGPEVMTPLDKAGGVGEGVTFHVHIGMYAGSAIEKRQIAEDLWEEIKRVGQAKKMLRSEL